MKALLKGDLVVGVVEGDLVDNLPELSTELSIYPLEQLRFDGTKIVHMSDYNKFYIDNKGVKHILPLNPSWQLLECSWDEKIIYDPLTGKWRKKTEEENLRDVKQEKIERLRINTRVYILRFYPEDKQQSDRIDMEYYSNWLLKQNANYTIDKIRKDIYACATQIISKQISLQEILNSLPPTEQIAWEQLIKASVRSSFIIAVKQEYHQKLRLLEKASTLEEVQAIDIESFQTSFPNL